MKTFTQRSLLLLAASMLAACGGGNGSSLNYSDYVGPYFQTINFSRNLVTETDPTTILAVNYDTQVDIVMPDSRSTSATTVSAYHFIASYENKDIDIYVNPELGDQTIASQEAWYYANIIGQIPLFLRDGINNINGIDNVYVHSGFEPVTGTGNALIIYADRALELVAQGILEEVLIHESAHVALDADLASSADWLAAQMNDGNAISQLAYDLPDVDVAETLLAYIAQHYRANRLDVVFGFPAVDQTILETIPNRIAYFDTRGFEMSPIVADQVGAWDSANAQFSYWQHPSLFAYYEQWQKTIILF
jgi:hypothetical protein